VVALREIAESKMQLDVLRESIVKGLQKHSDIDRPEEGGEMLELEQELAATLAQQGAEASQPRALPGADEYDDTDQP